MPELQPIDYTIMSALSHNKAAMTKAELCSSIPYKKASVDIAVTRLKKLELLDSSPVPPPKPQPVIPEPSAGLYLDQLLDFELTPLPPSRKPGRPMQEYSITSEGKKVLQEARNDPDNKNFSRSERRIDCAKLPKPIPLPSVGEIRAKTPSSSNLYAVLLLLYLAGDTSYHELLNGLTLNPVQLVAVLKWAERTRLITDKGSNVYSITDGGVAVLSASRSASAFTEAKSALTLKLHWPNPPFPPTLSPKPNPSPRLTKLLALSPESLRSVE